MPRFDEPTFTVDAGVIFSSGEIGLAPAQPLPRLTAAREVAVSDPSDEALVAVEHRRIRTLSNYWHAGWRHATPLTVLRTDVVARLHRVVERLEPDWGLAIFDAWRPLPLQIELYEAAISDPEVVEGFMALPSDDPATPPPHLSGGAVDLTLTYRGTPLALGTGFDDTTETAFVDAFESQPGVVRELRRQLYAVMAAEEFVVYEGEWWHFEFGTSRWADLRGERARYAAIAPE